MYLLEHIHISADRNMLDARFPVQYVVRPQTDEFHDYRGYAGRVASGIFRKGDTVKVLPSGFTSKIKSIDSYNEQLDEAFAPMSVNITLEDDLDISRGDMIVRENNVPEVSQDVDAMICWFNSRPLQLRGMYVLRHTTADVRCRIQSIQYKVDVRDLHRDEEDKQVGMNDIARIQLRTTQPLFFDAYNRNRFTGSFILVDEATNETVAAGMIR